MNAQEFGNAEIDAIEAASKRVENMLKRPDQLERVEQIRRREARKKASVEARLKTAMQSQLDGVRTGLTQLQSALATIKEVRSWVKEVDSKYLECAELSSKLGEVKEVANRHSQLAAAVENLKHIFTVPENVKKTERFIEEEKLLLAHKGLMELESSRDDLLYELHKHPSENPSDDYLLKNYFADVDQLSDQLFKHIKVVLQRLLNCARENPALLVTALRIIEREERIDKKMSDREKMAGFHAPGRPKEWRKRALSEMKKVALVRFEGSQLEDRTEDKMWLVRHLELVRQNAVGDLTTVKHLCVPCFPPDYYIFQYFINMYQDCLATHLQDIINAELEHNEIIYLLTWLTEYEGSSMLGDPNLAIDVSKIPPLLPNQDVDNLQQQYMRTLTTNIQTWMSNALDTDVKDWHRDTEPESDGEGFFRTQLPVIIFQMIEQNLQVSNQISKDLTTKVVLLCVEELQAFVETYRSIIRDYKFKHLQDRSEPKFYFQYMVAIVNNFHSFNDFTRQLERKHLGLPAEEEGTTIFHGLMDSFNRLAGDCMGDLLNEMFMDLEPHLIQLLTRPWFQIHGSPAIDTVCITIEDYYRDFLHLRKDFFGKLLQELEVRVITAYLKALVDRRMTFKSYEERKAAAEKIAREAEQMERLFERLSPVKSDPSPTEAILTLTEVVKLMDTSLISLEISTLVHKYPDIRNDHLCNLLVLRGDITAADARQTIVETIGEDNERPINQNQKTIFSSLPQK
ncbi:exocyst complex component 3-like isoform X2 [Amphiura filiformis]|uniref:exocyst complex component 3-like isoform X2 n=1 Tax=Amphiura filiformis TaxID=82378 RepID=UPI003B215B27